MLWYSKGMSEYVFYVERQNWFKVNFPEKRREADNHSFTRNGKPNLLWVLNKMLMPSALCHLFNTLNAYIMMMGNIAVMFWNRVVWYIQKCLLMLSFSIGLFLELKKGVWLFLKNTLYVVILNVSVFSFNKYIYSDSLLNRSGGKYISYLRYIRKLCY